MPVLKIKKADGTWQEVWGATSGGGGATGGADVARLSTVTMPASGWSGSNGMFSQEVTCVGATENSTLDLQPSPSQVAALQQAKTALMLTNHGSTIVAIAIGNKPTVDYTMDVRISEVIRV